MNPLRVLILAILAACSAFPRAAPPPPANSAFQALVKDARSRIKEIDAAQLKTWLGSEAKTVLIDVREDGEWQAGHAAAGVHIGRGVLEREIEGAVPDKGARVVLYCQGGSRSALAADTLQKMG